MPTLSTQEAIERLNREVEGMRPDDLLDFYNELFPEKPRTSLSPAGDGADERRIIAEQLKRGPEIEEILDLWNATFPEAWDVHFDDETGLICYSEGPSALRSAD